MNEDALDARINGLIATFAAAGTKLSRGLGNAVQVAKGLWSDNGYSEAVFICRAGLGAADYDEGGQSARFRMNVQIAAQTSVMMDAPTTEQRVNRLAANVLAVAADNLDKAGDEGWIWLVFRGSQATRLRNSHQQAYEVEVMQFEMGFDEVF